MSSQRLPIEEHPDITELQGRYERIGQKPAVQMGAGLIVLTGLFVALSPWIAGFAMSTPLAVNNLVVGLTAVALALGFAASFRTTHGLSWVVPLLGVWTIVAPWVIYNADHSLRVILCNVIGGAVLFLSSMAVVGSGMMRRKNERTST